MHWKKSKGKDDLFRSTDRFGYGKSLGPRSSETEKTLREFPKRVFDAAGQELSSLEVPPEFGYHLCVKR